MSVASRFALTAGVGAALIVLTGCQGAAGWSPSVANGGRGGGGTDSGVSPSPASSATAAPTLALTFPNTTIHRGTDTTLSITLDTHGLAVNAVQVYLVLPSGRLSCAAAAVVTAPQFTTSATKCTSTVGALAISTSADQPFTGNSQVATIRLLTGTVTGKAAVKTEPKRSFVVVAETNQNALAQGATATITVK